MALNSYSKKDQPLVLTEKEKEMLEWTKMKGMAYRSLMAYYRCAIKEVETKFRVLDEEYSLKNDRNPINGIKSRLKTLPSIIEKLERKGLEVSVGSIEKNLNDVAGIRVICSFVQDVYKLAEAFLKQDDITLIQIKDYIKQPKENGYRSLHLIVEVPIFLEHEKKPMRVEIQLRTIAMDCWASLEHQLLYKKDTEFTPEMQASLTRCAEISTELDMEMDELREKSNI